MDVAEICRSCQYLSLVLTRPIKCERHGEPRTGASSKIDGDASLLEPVSNSASTTTLGGMDPVARGAERIPFTPAELARLRILRGRRQSSATEPQSPVRAEWPPEDC